MSDPLSQMSVFLFLGLAVAFGGLTTLLAAERTALQTRHRILRAAGLRNPQKRQRSGSLRHLAKTLRDAVLKAGERASVILGGEAQATQDDLVTAGYTGRDALLVYAFLKTVLPIATLVVGSGFVISTVPFGIDMMLPLAGTVAGALAISKAVDFAVNAKRKARLDSIRIAFPDMLELLVITSEAGLGPQPALHRVADELQVAHPELARETLQLVSEMRMTNNRRAAYDRLNTRVPLPEIAVFTQTLEQSDTYGTPFSRAMRTLITDQRADRLLRVEEKAARLPVIMTIPLIFCIMPAVFVVLVGPAVLSVIDNIIAGG